MARKLLTALLVIVIAAVALYLVGPRVAANTTVTFDPASIGPDPEAYLAKREADVAGLREGLAKEIVWANPATKAKTPLAVVYVHGFSASKGEVRPLPDKVAAALGANLFFTRLTGHGQDGAAMATASVNAWVNDTAEAFAIGRAIGDKVIVMATSTGGTLSALELANPAVSENVAAAIFISPNFRVQAAGASLLTGPWGKQIAELIGGKERGFEPPNNLVKNLWTTKYPMAATLPMAATVKLSEAINYEAMTTPALFVISDSDKVVDPAATRAIAARWGAPHEIVAVDNSGDPSNHVNAGDAYSPQTTDPLAATIVEWLQGVGAAK
jgi:alpha-beta hydrolase superfamily lysophospholipase